MNLVTFVIFTISLRAISSSECYWNSCCPYKHLSSKTPYNLVRGDIRDSVVKLDGCQAISIWSLIRHGKRTPGIDYGRNMKNALGLRDYITRNYEQGKSSLCAQDVENLRNWQADSDLFDKIHSLTDEGYLESVGIGSRLKEAFSELLEQFHEGSYRFLSAFGNWTEDSISGFVKGLTNQTLNIEKFDSNGTYDILSPYENCSKYRSEVRRNPFIYEEAKKYETSLEYKYMKLALEKRVGLESLNSSTITALYDLCRYTWSGIRNEPSPWCALFSPHDLEVLEYVEDLRHYYRNGYGTPINHFFGHIPLSDLYKSFSESKMGRGKTLLTYFSHATMMDMVISAMGLFKDASPLTGEYRDPNRKWRSSKMAVFGANLIAVLNKCSTDNNTTEYKVIFYLNEHLLTEICNAGICTWQEFEDKFKSFVNTNLEFCFTESRSTKKSS